MADDQPSQPSFLDKFTMPLNQLWKDHVGFLLIFGIGILIFKFRDVIMDLLVSDVHKQVDEAKKQDSALRQEENKANDQANELRKEATDLGQNKPKVDEDWYKK